MNRVRKEFAIIQQMWSKNTTLYELKEKARAGIPLPDIVLVKGTLTARGRPVTSVASKVAELKPFIGSIEQPSNFFLDLGSKVLSGEVTLPKGFDLEKVYKFDDVERVEDDFRVGKPSWKRTWSSPKYLLRVWGAKRERK